MSPQPSIAHYRILSKLGEGGMGAVYRATDTKLNRDVAVKLLPEALSDDADRMSRFRREAQVLASLNHPNIAAIYGVEDRALVLELVEGATLADRIAQGPIPVEEAIPIAKQIAEALEYAHEKGIVHRDLKPANIKLTPEGRVKVLDFGLAKALTSDTAFATDPASSPTVTMRSSTAGLILGTAGYMSPEQAKGKPVDRRADIWAFGVVFAEMLRGRAMYTGDTISEILASVIKDQPDLDHLPALTPSSVRLLLGRCLNRDPRRRLQAIGEARVALEDPEEPATGPVPEADRRGSRMWQVAAGFLGIALVAALVLLWRATRSAEEPTMRLNVELGPGAMAGERISAIISPDGRRIVYPARMAGGSHLATRLLDQSESTAITGSDGGADPFFSPDGQWVGFFADGKLKKASVQGGAPVTLAEVTGPGLRGAVWGADGEIIANLDLRHLWRVPAAGGKPQLLSLNAEGNVGYRWPQILPDGETLLVTASSTVAAYDDADIVAVSLKTGQHKVILSHGGFCARALPTGHLIYVHQGVLMAVRFDSRRLEIYGTPQPMVENVAGNPTSGAGQFDISGTGTLVYLSGNLGSDTHAVVWMDEAGTQVPLLPSAARLTPRLSPDGTRLALSENGDLSVFEIGRGAMTRITFTHASNLYPLWAPDGKHIVYTSASKEIWWTRADGSAQPEKLWQSGTVGAAATSFSRDGKRLAIRQIGVGTDQGIWILPLDLNDGDHPRPGAPEFFVHTPGADTEPAFSPDGRWVAYTSAESGILQVYVRPYPAGAAGGKWQISTGPGSRFPLWSPSGRQLFYVSLDGRIMVVDYEAQGDAFHPGRSRRWSETPIQLTGIFPPLDLAPDEKRFVVFPAPQSNSSPGSNAHVTFLIHFFDELNRRIPPK